jgi:hypothetical protein
MAAMKLIEKLKRDPRVQDAWSEVDSDDGYWITLKSGWRSITTECHCVHEWSIRDLLRDFKDIEPCRCDACLQDAVLKPTDEQQTHLSSTKEEI